MKPNNNPFLTPEYRPFARAAILAAVQFTGKVRLIPLRAIAAGLCLEAMEIAGFDRTDLRWHQAKQEVGRLTSVLRDEGKLGHDREAQRWYPIENN